MFPIRDHNPSHGTPFVTWSLIAVNVIIHLVVMTTVTDDRSLSRLYYDYAMIPARLTGGEAWGSLVTSTFLHGGLMHLAGNMLFLWIFGDNLEETLGHAGFLVFYLLSGAGATAAQWAIEPYSQIPVIGASGAIAGVMGGYLLLFPRAKVDILLILIVFVRIFPIPAWIMLGLWFGLQLVNGLGSIGAVGGGVAYWAHAGGFVIGLALMVLPWLLRGGPAFWSRTEGHPPHAEADYGRLSKSGVPVVPRVRR